MSLSSLWKRYTVRWDFITKLCASVPADPEMRQAWLEARQPSVRPPSSRSLAEINEEVVATMAEPTQEEVGGLLVFQRVNGVLCMRAATVKAHLKDCARFISSQYVGKIKGERSFAVRVLNAVYPDPLTYWIPILSQESDGKPVREATGRFDKAVHVATMQGPRSAIKTIEYVEDARLEWTMLVMCAKSQGEKAPKPVVSEEDLSILMQYGGVHGYAGERGDGEGRYTFTITEVQ